MGMLEDLVETRLIGKTPGAAVAMTRGDERVELMHGFADLEWEQPVTTDTVFRVGSVSKPFTALTVLLLARDGAIDLDASIASYLPEMKGRGNVTLRHLLTHSSGIANFVTRPDFLTELVRRDMTDDDMLAHLATMPDNFEPGTRYSYSNSGYRLLDIAIAKVTGRPYAEVLHDRVFAPAGMANSHMLGDLEIIPRRARGYQNGPRGFLNSEYASMTIPGGAGGAGCSVEDLLRFDRALAGGVYGDIAELFEPVELTSGRAEAYGLGWGLSTYRGRATHHHAGGIHGFSSLFVRVPAEDMCLVVLTNMQGYNCLGVARAMLDEAYGPVEDVASATPSPVRTGRHIGVYSESLHRVEIRADTADPTMLIVVDGETETSFVRTGDAWQESGDPGTTLRFHESGDAAGDALTITYPLHWETLYREAAAENR